MKTETAIIPTVDGRCRITTTLGGEAIAVDQGEALDLLLGRQTYDIWSGFWPKAPSSLVADSIDAATKYVATHRPDSLEWGPVEDLGPKALATSTAKDGPDLILWSSSTLTSTLLEHGLADEVVLLVYPVLLEVRFWAIPPAKSWFVPGNRASSYWHQLREVS